MKSRLLSLRFQNSLKAKVENYYKILIKVIKNEKNLVFKQELKKVIKDPILKTYSPLKFYWASLLEEYFFLLKLTKDKNLEEIFNFWEKSEFCEDFLSILKNKSVLRASKILQKTLEIQISSFFYLHFKNYAGEVLYLPIEEIGDSTKRLYFGDEHFYVDLKKPVKKPLFINKDEFHLNIRGIGKVPIKIGNFLISRSLSLIPRDEGIGRFDEFKEKIERALEILKKYSPDSFKTFMSFTHTILPVNDPGIVSYSLQNLPGYSLINFFERDFVDLLDDLLHENGHHYLNTFLNCTDLLNEDEEKIYYSPWRRTYRPIRGIFHACFTFFWALHLFGTLFKNLKKMDFFSEKEKQKITARFIEEYLMLKYCIPDLEHAYKSKKINRQGIKLIREIYSQIEPFKKDLDLAWDFLKNKRKLVLLKKTLVAKRILT